MFAINENTGNPGFSLEQTSATSSYVSGSLRSPNGSFLQDVTNSWTLALTLSRKALSRFVLVEGVPSCSKCSAHISRTSFLSVIIFRSFSTRRNFPRGATFSCLTTNWWRVGIKRQKKISFRLVENGLYHQQGTRSFGRTFDFSKVSKITISLDCAALQSFAALSISIWLKNLRKCFLYSLCLVR